MNKFYLSCFVLFLGVPVLAQETTTPVLNKSNRIILHFNDTTGKFRQLARILVDRGHDIDMKDPELGVLRTKASPIRSGYFNVDELAIKTIFRDSTITFAGIAYLTGYDRNSTLEVLYSKKMSSILMVAWTEMMTIAEQLKPASITYTTVDINNRTK